ncbi:4'-phosphopantetheinyl transferase family protein [Actinomyces weissii]|uniref:4'-phosphopantetheinyl transferase superfamily protein n=1 Tax=Actinomyces weissii TaxID=675090 RepID=A0A7T7M8H2_9ACTO|nr:4'-phosphopantetheinyl transferase superfamily protein [Actinomyces weissii]QQM66758.1 4'-phosphopantetheinyl transferase superfamily protein [Actinomyces weissii]
MTNLQFLIGGLTRYGLVAIESFSPLQCILFPEEIAYLEGASFARRSEFKTVRRLAAEALATLNIRRPIMVPSYGGAPTWPTEVIGSLTHCKGYAAAAIAYRAIVDAIGIDAERNIPVTSRTFQIATNKTEQEYLDTVTSIDPTITNRLLLSAKESAFKAWFPKEHKKLLLRDIRIEIHAGGSFCAKLPIGGRTCSLHYGRWMRSADLLITAFIVPSGEWPTRD